MAGCYILYSEKLNKFYVGATQDNIELRLQKHLEKFYGTHRFTASAEDWELFLFIDTADFSHAVRIERKIKSQKSSVYIRNLKKYPELVSKLLAQTKSST